MADFNLKYEFAPHWKNPGETEEIDWNTLEKIFIPDSKHIFFAVCYEISAFTSTKEAAHKLNMALIFPNSLHKTTWRQKTFNFYQKEAQDWGGGDYFNVLKYEKKYALEFLKLNHINKNLYWINIKTFFPTVNSIKFTQNIKF